MSLWLIDLVPNNWDLCSKSFIFFPSIPFSNLDPILSIVAATATSLFSSFFFFFPTSLVSSLLMHYNCVLLALVFQIFLSNYLVNDIRWLGGSGVASRVSIAVYLLLF